MTEISVENAWAANDTERENNGPAMKVSAMSIKLVLVLEEGTPGHPNEVAIIAARHGYPNNYLDAPDVCRDITVIRLVSVRRGARAVSYSHLLTTPPQLWYNTPQSHHRNTTIAPQIRQSARSYRRDRSRSKGTL